MNSFFDSSIWIKKKPYITPHNEFKNTYGKNTKQFDIGSTCIITFSSSLYKKAVETTPNEVTNIVWPFGETTPLKVFKTKNGKRFSIHFPSYGGTRIANSLEQLAACGVKQVIGIGVGGTPQETLAIGEVVVLEGAINGTGAARYYAPIEYPAIADFKLVTKLSSKLQEMKIAYRTGISFSIDAIYREEETLIARLKELNVLLVDLESSAFFTIGRRLGLKCAWIGVISDRLVFKKHEGKVQGAHVKSALLQLKDIAVDIIDKL